MFRKWEGVVFPLLSFGAGVGKGLGCSTGVGTDEHEPSTASFLLYALIAVWSGGTDALPVSDKLLLHVGADRGVLERREVVDRPVVYEVVVGAAAEKD